MFQIHRIVSRAFRSIVYFSVSRDKRHNTDLKSPEPLACAYAYKALLYAGLSKYVMYFATSRDAIISEKA